jgi:hypothetical protein
MGDHDRIIIESINAGFSKVLVTVALHEWLFPRDDFAFDISNSKITPNLSLVYHEADIVSMSQAKYSTQM